MGKPEVRAWDRASNEYWIQANRKFGKRRAGGKRIMVFEPLGRGLDGEMGCFSRHQWCHHVPSTPQAKSLFWSRLFNTSRTRLRSLARGRYHHLTHLRFHKMTDLWFPRCKIQFEGKDRHHAFPWNLPKPNLFHTFLGKKTMFLWTFPQESRMEAGLGPEFFEFQSGAVDFRDASRDARRVGTVGAPVCGHPARKWRRFGMREADWFVRGEGSRFKIDQT